MSEVAVKERPIPFSGPMVRAIERGDKTQTRRVMKPQIGERDGYSDDRVRQGVVDWVDHEGQADPRLAWRCPYGKVGDRLWVREAWAELEDQYGGTHIVYRADECHSLVGADKDGYEYLLTKPEPIDWDAEGPDVHCFNREDLRWRPSIHMPRWASRIKLEITDLRVQRVQEISEADARAEGCPARVYDEETGVRMPNAEGAFAALWDSINAKRGHGWQTNPWVWAVTFRRISDA